MSAGALVPVVASIVDTVSLSLFATKTVARHRPRAGTADTLAGKAPNRAAANPNTTTTSTRIRRMAAPCLAIPLGHRRHGVTATPRGPEPTVMSLGFLVRVFTSIVETESLIMLVTKAVLPSGVIATPVGAVPTAMLIGLLVLDLRSIVDTELPPGTGVTPKMPPLTTKAILP